MEISFKHSLYFYSGDIFNKGICTQLRDGGGESDQSHVGLEWTSKSPLRFFPAFR